MRKSLTALFLLNSVFMMAQEKPLEMKMDFEEYDPPSTLVVEEHHLTRSKFPFIDIHNHQFNMNTSDFKELISRMDELNMAVMVNLSGRGFGGCRGVIILKNHLKTLTPGFQIVLCYSPILM